MIRLTYMGTIKYCENYIDNFDTIIKSIVAVLLNEKNIDNDNIYDKIDEPKIIINAIIEYFSKKGYLNMAKSIDGDFLITNITTEGKRAFKKYLL